MTVIFTTQPIDSRHGF